jgi:hypothetical protein
LHHLSGHAGALAPPHQLEKPPGESANAYRHAVAGLKIDFSREI